jgi:AAA domain
VLLWINGPFGGGKTHTAAELHRRLPGSRICDPEHVGFGLHRAMPRELRGDFQDLPAWRQGVFEVLDLALSRHDGTIIAPMTVIEPRYFDETVGRLREAGHDVRHFALLADRETVLRRLRQRSPVHAALFALGRDAPPYGDSFAVSRLDLCLDRLQDPRFAEQIRTDQLTIPQVADRIAAAAGIVIRPNTNSALQRRIHWLGTSVRHIRLG